jgi:inosine-uridine nucleoside N-ribohydrolase
VRQSHNNKAPGRARPEVQPRRRLTNDIMKKLRCSPVPLGTLAGIFLGVAALVETAEPASARKPIPVILATDIGDDIDDTWALGLILRSPELDLKLAVGDYGRATYRARLLARFLERVGRTDVPVGVGMDIEPKGDRGRQAEWIKGYDLKAYPGKVYADGVQAMIDLIMKSDQPVTLIAIGPLPNVAEALKREPRIAQRARFVGMQGSVRRGYGGAPKPDAEWNVKANPQACRAVFTAAWDITITPLDTCGLVRLRGDKYARVRDSKDPVAVAIIENYRAWTASSGETSLKALSETASSTLFDTVAVYLAFSHDLCAMERVPLQVTDDGYTRIEPSAKAVLAALDWKDLSRFEDLLASRLISHP